MSGMRMTGAGLTMDPEQLIARLEQLSGELDQTRALVDHTSRLATVGAIAAGVAHEVNNLLTPALAYGQLARSGNEDPAMLRKAVERSMAGIEAATSLLGSILELSRPTPPGMATPVDEVIDAAINCLPRDPERDGITIQRRIEPGLAAPMSPLSLQQVVLNLLLNAAKAIRGHNRGGTISVTAVPLETGGLRIEVRDDGPGIPADRLDDLFEAFVTAPTSGRPQSAGTGLGLTICREAVSGAGGTICAANHPEGGACFVIELPDIECPPLAQAG